jgi:cis-L-3-hydroxyproline dehydratase
VLMIADDATEGIGFKISKLGGLTRGRRQRDICAAAGYTFSVQETAGSDVAFAALVHFAQAVPEGLLRCVLKSRDMTTVKTADGDFEVVDGCVRAPSKPGRGIEVRREVSRSPVATYS